MSVKLQVEGSGAPPPSPRWA